MLEDKRTSRVNDIGLRLTGVATEHMKLFQVYEESGTVIVETELANNRSNAIQYLSPEEAMAFAKAFERCAITALKGRA